MALTFGKKSFLSVINWRQV